MTNMNIQGKFSNPELASVKNRAASSLPSFTQQLNIYPVSRHCSRYYGFRSEQTRMSLIEFTHHSQWGLRQNEKKREREKEKV